MTEDERLDLKKHGLQIYNPTGGSGDPKEAVADPFDPTKNTLYLNNDDMFALNLPFLGKSEIPGPNMESAAHTVDNANTEFDSKKDGDRNMATGIVYALQGDDIHPAPGVIKSATTKKIDTIKWNETTNQYDTFREH